MTTATPNSTVGIPFPSPIPLGFWACFFITIPENIDQRRIPSPDRTKSSTNPVYYSCFFKQKLLTGDSAGPTVSVALCVLISVIGIIGVGTNITNYFVLKRSLKESTFGKLLLVLTGFDLITCFFVVFTCVFLQLILDNVNRSAGMLWVFKSCFLLYSLGRTGSVYITILITIERYFVIAHHFQAKLWLTPRRRVILTLSCLVIIAFINLPWWLNSTVATLNSDLLSTGPLAKFPSIFVTTYFGTNIYFTTWFRRVHNFVNFVLPLPLLLLFNALLYKFIYQNWNKSREILTSSNTREMKTAKMFSVIVLSLFSCHTLAVINFLVQDVYKDVVLTIMLAVTVNSTINFFVYYAFGHDFRKHFWVLFSSHKGESNYDPARSNTSIRLHEPRESRRNRN